MVLTRHSCDKASSVAITQLVVNKLDFLHGNLLVEYVQVRVIKVLHVIAERSKIFLPVRTSNLDFVHGVVQVGVQKNQSERDHVRNVGGHVVRVGIVRVISFGVLFQNTINLLTFTGQSEVPQEFSKAWELALPMVTIIFAVLTSKPYRSPFLESPCYRRRRAKREWPSCR